MQIEGIQIVPIDESDPQQKKKSLTGRFPVLEDTENGGLVVSDGLTIARYLARDSAQFTQGLNLE